MWSALAYWPKLRIWVLQLCCSLYHTYASCPYFKFIFLWYLHYLSERHGNIFLFHQDYSTLWNKVVQEIANLSWLITIINIILDILHKLVLHYVHIYFVNKSSIFFLLVMHPHIDSWLATHHILAFQQIKLHFFFKYP